jgi:nucleoside-diphosphate-sugar epimerase
VRRLLADGQDVRVLLRRESNNAAVDGLDVERVYGDLHDLDFVARAVKGCTTAYHVAAHVSTLEPTPDLERTIWESNVLGTQHVLRAALHYGLERVVVTGSFSAVGYDLDDPERPGNETMPHYPFGGVLPYGQTKALVELESWKAALEGLDVVVATSCAILGPHDHKPSRMGFTLVECILEKIPFICSRIPAFDEVLQQLAGSRKSDFATESPEELARALKRAASMRPVVVNKTRASKVIAEWIKDIDSIPLVVKKPASGAAPIKA